jgi:hypothetical protein
MTLYNVLYHAPPPSCSTPGVLEWFSSDTSLRLRQSMLNSKRISAKQDNTIAMTRGAGVIKKRRLYQIRLCDMNCHKEVTVCICFDSSHNSAVFCQIGDATVFELYLTHFCMDFYDLKRKVAVVISHK